MTALLTVEGLTKIYATPRGDLTALDDVSFSVGRGEAVAIVGESGCGKSTLALSIVRLVGATRGRISFDGLPASQFQRASPRQLALLVGMVFQNPYASLNPRMRVLDSISEPLRIIARRSRDAARERATALLGSVGLGTETFRRFPHALSGGQRQRVAIARALALNPGLLVLDEPTAALDVSVQAQVLNLLADMRATHNLSYLLISHNLATVEHVADRVIVMYLGTIVESGPVEQVFAWPRHPYTRALLEAVPRPRVGAQHGFARLPGEPTSAIDRPPGCPFAPRCAHRTGICENVPPAITAGADGRQLACHHPLNKAFEP